MTRSARRAVFLDRDGVLNACRVIEGKPLPPLTVEEFKIIPGTREALTQLRDAGFLLIVATNQPDVGRGTQTIACVEAMHAVLLRELPLDHIEVCYDGEDGSPRRKPAPGMLLDAARAMSLDLRASFMIGDRWRDISAGRAAGCGTVFIDYGYAEKRPEPPADHTTVDLAGAARYILSLLR